MKKRIDFILHTFKRYLLLIASVGFCLGIIVGDSLSKEEITYIVIVLMLITFIFIFSFDTGNRLRFLVFILSILLGLVRLQLEDFLVTSRYHILSYENQHVEFEGIASCGEVINANYLLIDNIIVDDKGSKSRIFGKVLIKTEEVGSGVDCGQRVKISGDIEGLPKYFKGSYKNSLNAKNIYSIVTRIDGAMYTDNSGVWLQNIPTTYKGIIIDRISSIITEPHASLLTGIVFGGDQILGEELEKDLRSTGTTHIIAVSGYNISVLVSSISFISLLIGRKYMLKLSLVFIILFMVFVGISNIPVLRAGLMSIAMIIGKISGKKSAINTLLPLTVSILLFINPFTFKLLSFQLSFLSTFGLVILTKSLEGKLQFIPEFSREDVASTLSAIAYTLPITLFNFNQISIIAPLVNFLILPVVPLITIGGLILIILVFTLLPIAKIFVYFLWIVLEYMIQIIKLFGSLDYAMMDINPETSTLLSGLLCVILVLLSVEIKYQESKKI
ncbi:ComEC/Rec2 family competence protein [Candidatus Dojkabacteria bacterium]|nr:ComEC/Rec2 family competence protein [Candidatus Dojkabacteria bacterium]